MSKKLPGYRTRRHPEFSWTKCRKRNRVEVFAAEASNAMSLGFELRRFVGKVDTGSLMVIPEVIPDFFGMAACGLVSLRAVAFPAMVRVGLAYSRQGLAF